MEKNNENEGCLMTPDDDEFSVSGGFEYDGNEVTQSQVFRHPKYPNYAIILAETNPRNTWDNEIFEELVNDLQRRFAS